MGFFSDLFSPRREEVAPPQASITQAPTQTPEQQDFLKSLLKALQGAADAGGRAKGFEGQLTAGVSPLQQQGFGSVQQLLESGSQAQNLVQNALQPFSEEQTIDRFNRFQVPFAQMNQRESQRQLLERLAGTGGFDSGATARAFAKGEQEFNLGLQSLLGQQLNLDQSRQEQRQFQGLESLLGLQGQALGAGGQQRGIEQEGLNAILQEFIRRQGVDPLLSLAPTGLGAQPFENIATVGSTGFGASAVTQIGQLLQGAGGLAKGIASF